MNMETTEKKKHKMRAEYYREWRARKRVKAAEAATETNDIKADFRAALSASVALQKAVASREDTIRHLEKMVERLSADQSARLERIETALQAMLAVPLAAAPHQAPSHPVDTADQKPAPPWMKR
jgi:cysteinyl-tRNA synthetase